MKKTLFLSIAVALLLSACFIFDYNGGATVIVKNTGELEILARLEYNYNIIKPGEEGKFELTWPGHEDMHINLTLEVSGRPDVHEVMHFYIADEETRVIEHGFYASDL